MGSEFEPGLERAGGLEVGAEGRSEDEDPKPKASTSATSSVESARSVVVEVKKTGSGAA